MSSQDLYPMQYLQFIFMSVDTHIPMCVYTHIYTLWSLLGIQYKHMFFNYKSNRKASLYTF